MIRLPGDEDEVKLIAQTVLNSPAGVKIAGVAAKRLGILPGAAFEALRFHLAYAYAQGYVQGWQRARRERGERPPPPDPNRP